MGQTDLLERCRAYCGRLRKALPAGNGGPDVIDDCADLPGGKPLLLAQAFNMGSGRPPALSIDIEIMLAAGPWGIGQVVYWSQAPDASFVHEEGMLSTMIVAIVGEHVKDHSAEHRGNILAIASDPAGEAHQHVVA